jgi:hypothetical protein
MPFVLYYKYQQNDTYGDKMVFTQWPVVGKISQTFASNPNDIQPNGHTGVDFAIPTGTPIHAIGNGTVIWADWASKLSASNQWWIAPAYAGIVVLIDHGNGYVSVYAHLSETSLNIGNKVTTNQVIGKSGATGLATGPHLHFEIFQWPSLQPYNGFYGRVNPSTLITSIAAASVTPLKANQRKVGAANVNMRAGASTSSKILRVIPANSIETFTGYYNGERINGNNLWYRDAQGFAHSAGFTTVSANGLPNTTPAPAPKANERVVGAANVNLRASASTSAKILKVLPAKSTQAFTGYVIGERVNNKNLWYKNAEGYAHCDGFTTQVTTGLTDQTPKPAPAPAPAPATPTPSPTTPVTPEPATYSFTKDFDFVEYIPAAPNNLLRGNFPDKPAKVVIHQFGTLGIDTLSSTVNTFSNNANERVSSAHFVVSGKRIIQMVSLKDRAYHAGKVGNDYVGIETDPAQDADTIASTKKLLQALKDKYGYELEKTLHKDVPGNSTNCGASITLSNYNLETPVVVIPVPTPTEPTPTDIPETPVVVIPSPAPVEDDEVVIDEFLAEFRKVLLSLRK